MNAWPGSTLWNEAAIESATRESRICISLEVFSASTLLIESSTLTVGWIEELATAAVARGCEFLDAPVTGSKPHAESGELLFLVGGSARAFESAKDIFAVLGRGAVHLGATGSGALLKLINNFLAAVQAASFSEALALIDAGGLDREKAMSILTEGVPGSPMVKRVATRVASDDFTPHFLIFFKIYAKIKKIELLQGNLFFGNKNETLPEEESEDFF